jgi:D-alanyl-D-alanine dipeptidase
MAHTDTTSQIWPKRIRCRPQTWLRASVVLVALALSGQLDAQDVPAQEEAPPAALVHLRDIDPSIIQDIRYAGPNNFTGQPVAGYAAPECLLLRDVAKALSRVQDQLQQRKLALKVYDCYRPRRAVRAFRNWVQDPVADPLLKRFHPNLEKSQLISLGYIAGVSRHSRGDTVDLTLVALPAKHVALAPARPMRGHPTTASTWARVSIASIRSAIRKLPISRWSRRSGVSCWWMPWRDRGSTTIPRSGGILRTSRSGLDGRSMCL